jgi:hypothetical protein
MSNWLNTYWSKKCSKQKLFKGQNSLFVPNACMLRIACRLSVCTKKLQIQGTRIQVMRYHFRIDLDGMCLLAYRPKPSIYISGYGNKREGCIRKTSGIGTNEDACCYCPYSVVCSIRNLPQKKNGILPSNDSVVETTITHLNFKEETPCTRDTESNEGGFHEDFCLCIRFTVFV